MTEEILALATALGKVEESGRLRTLCAAAETELAGLLRPGTAPEDCGGAFPLAAAWMALASLAVAEEDGVRAFTAGDVTVRREGRERREALRLQARQVMKPYLRDQGFAFWGVRG